MAIEEPQKQNLTYPGTTWQKADPEKFGWEVKKPDTAFAYAQSLGPGGLMVIDKGVTVVDWGATDYRSKIASVRKSLLSALYGIHVQTGKIELDQTLANSTLTINRPVLRPKRSRPPFGWCFRPAPAFMLPQLGRCR